MWRIYRKFRVISGLHQEGFQLLLLLLLSKIIRWEGGDWVEVGDEPLGRSSGPGWRFSEGILVFGGSHTDDVDANSAVHLDNDYANQGGLIGRIRMVKLPPIV